MRTVDEDKKGGIVDGHAPKNLFLTVQKSSPSMASIHYFLWKASTFLRTVKSGI